MPAPALRDVSSRYGAPMGRTTSHPLNFMDPIRFYLRRVHLNNSGYDSGGAYWGLGGPLYYATSVEEVAMTYGEPRQAEIFLRAFDRNDAKANLRRNYPRATFFR